MEIRILRYFLEIAREGNMTRAAQRLHVSQPSLSRQMKDLEAELEKKLFVRDNYSIRLTEEGMLLQRRAEELLAMADKITEEFKEMDMIVGGDVHIGCAESHLVKYLAAAVRSLNRRYPRIHYHIVSGDTEIVADRITRGLSDMAFILEPPDLSKYNYIKFPECDSWGVIMRKECPLAGKESVCVEDVLPYPVFCSEQGAKFDLPRWCGESFDRLNIMATFNLINNAAVFVREGLGISFALEHLIEFREDGDLCFRPLSPALHTDMYLIWRKHQSFSAAAQLLLDELKNMKKANFR